MKELVQEVRKHLRDLLAVFRHGPTYKIERVPEIPDCLKARTIYLLGAPHAWSAALLCPCGCRETIHISLLANDSPSWRLRLNAKNEPTLQPSVWRKNGCKSHFFVRNGRIVWFIQSKRPGRNRA